MSKVSVGMRGWRFDEEELFTPDGEYVPFEEMSEETRQRIVRLGVLYGSPCDACWLIHGDENLDECNEAEYVYGEPLAEVVVCESHEPDFVYWFRESGGSEYAGADDFDDHFHEWFLEGNRAPEGYDGMEYRSEAPDELPDPPEIDEEDVPVEAGEVIQCIDVRDVLDEEYPTADQ